MKRTYKAEPRVREQFRSLRVPGRHSRNQTVAITIPREMVWALEWTGLKPVKIELMDDRSLRITEMDPETEGLVRGGNHGWRRRVD